MDEVETPSTLQVMQQDAPVDVADPAPTKAFATTTKCCFHWDVCDLAKPPPPANLAEGVEISLNIAVADGDGGTLRAVLDLNVSRS